LIVAVIGGSQCPPAVARTAEEVGRELARHGATVICGGLGGVMEAVCRGARSEGGITIGVLPGDDPSTANAYVSIPIVTGMGYARNVIIVRSAQAVIAIDGQFGTLSEMAHALQFGVPVVGLNTWSLSKDGRFDDSIIIAEDASDAVVKALAAARGS